ncbi:ribosomal protein S18-alanine N-acetyltransferase [Nocardiopsis xinjiangensis]|uniref:ribosomal protein S18-alanine N-acetyltransferase n=1 Tax=Nocardiopsis xinjiangensis TaxID=124285 RepID=UPI00037DAE38|nr:ribosomal protein S18-alanine N-acetyltransferase [Nocardiopsis xinjiangensis]
MTPVRLRPMNLADVGPVMALETALFPEDAWSQYALLSELAEPGRHYVVAESDGEVVGYAGLRAAAPEGDVQTMAVDERLWGSGVGSALLTALLEEARRRGITRMFLDVRADNPRAQKLYTGFGFVRVGVRDGYYNGTDAITMLRVDEAGGSGHKEDR